MLVQGGLICLFLYGNFPKLSKKFKERKGIEGRLFQGEFEQKFAFIF